MQLLEQQMMEIVQLGLVLEPNHTILLSLVDVLGSVGGVVGIKPEELFHLSISLRIALVIQDDGFFFTITILTGACWLRMSRKSIG